MRILLRDLAPNTNYNLQLRSKDSDSYSEWSKLFELSTGVGLNLPGAVRSLTANIVQGNYEVSWFAPTPLAGRTDADIRDYYITVQESPANSAMPIRKMYIMQTSFTFTKEENASVFGTYRGDLVITVQPRDKVGNLGPISTISRSKTKPSTPVGPLWAPVGSSFVGSWQAPTTNTAGQTLTDIKDYEITLIANSITKRYYTTGTRFELTFNDNKSAFGTAQPIVSFTVAARDSTGDASAATTPIIAQNPIPNPITNLEAYSAPDEIPLKWKPPTDDDILGYKITLNGPANLMYFGPNPNYNHFTVAYLTDHVFSITVVDIFLQESSVVMSAALRPKSPFLVDVDAPAPTTLTVVPNGTDTSKPAAVKLTWPAITADDFAGYHIRISLNVVPRVWQFVDVIDKLATETVVSGLQSQGSYVAQIRTYDKSVNTSAWSPEASGNASQSVVPPANISSDIQIITGGVLRSSNYVEGTPTVTGTGWLLSPSQLNLESGKVNARVISAGELRSNINITDPAKGTVGQPLWVLNLDGNMSINDAQVRGKIIVGNGDNNANVAVASSNYGGNGKQWSIRGDGSFDIKSGTGQRLQFSDAGMVAHNGIEETFNLSSAGNLTLKGYIKATSGEFSGNITSSARITGGVIAGGNVYGGIYSTNEDESANQVRIGPNESSYGGMGPALNFGPANSGTVRAYLRYNNISDNLAIGNPNGATFAGIELANNGKINFFHRDEFNTDSEGLREPGMTIDSRGATIYEVLRFSRQTRQQINLYNETYGIGVQNNTLYNRTNFGYVWFQGGTHNDGINNPGPGGTTLMRLDASGNLFIKGTINVQDVNGSPGATFDDSNLVHKTMIETISGLKNFTGGIQKGGSTIMSQIETDARYYQKPLVYTKAEGDARYAIIGSGFSQSDADARYLQLTGGTVNGTLTATTLYEGLNRVYSAGNPQFIPVTSVAGRQGDIVLSAPDVSGVYYAGNPNLSASAFSSIIHGGSADGGLSTSYSKGDHRHGTVPAQIITAGSGIDAAAIGVNYTISNTGVRSLAVVNNASVNASTGLVTLTNSLTPTFTSATIPTLTGTGVSVSGTLGVTGATTLSTLAVTSTSTFTGLATFGTLAVNSTSTFSGLATLNTMAVTSTSTFTGLATFGAVTINSTSTFGGLATFNAGITATQASISGITGALNISRYAGATLTGSPTTGTFAIGDFVIARDGNIWICTNAGTPGTWRVSGFALGTTVVGETTFGLASNAGAGATASRTDHTHGTPATPVTTLAGTAGQIGVSASTGAVTLTNLGILSIAQGAGITASTVAGATTITNTGVLTVTASGNLSSSGGQNPGITIVNNPTFTGVVSTQGRSRSGFNAQVSAIAPLATSASEFELSSNSLITIGESVAGDANPQITFYRTFGGFRQGSGLRQVYKTSNGPFAWQVGQTTNNATNIPTYGSETYTDLMTLTTSGALNTVGVLSENNNRVYSAVFGAATTVFADTTFGTASVVGTGTSYAKNDHSHGNPATPVTNLTLGATTANLTLSASVGAVAISMSPAPTFTGLAVNGTSALTGPTNVKGVFKVQRADNSTYFQIDPAVAQITFPAASISGDSLIDDTVAYAKLSAFTRDSISQATRLGWSGVDVLPNGGFEVPQAGAVPARPYGYDLGATATYTKNPAFTWSGDWNIEYNITTSLGAQNQITSNVRGQVRAGQSYLLRYRIRQSSGTFYNPTIRLQFTQTETEAWTYNGTTHKFIDVLSGGSAAVVTALHTWHDRIAIVTVPAGINWVGLNVYTNEVAPPTAASLQFDAIEMRPLVMSDDIGGVTVNKLLAGSITTDDINIGTAGRIYAGASKTAPSRLEFVGGGTDAARGIFAYSGGVNTVKLAADGSFSLQTATTGRRIDIDSAIGIELYNATERTFFADVATGSLTLKGIITATGGAFSGDVQVSTGSLFMGSAATTGQRIKATSAGIKAFTSTSTSDITGQTLSINTDGSISFASGTFTVTTAGALTATGATVSGALTATTGNIGGFSLDANQLISQAGTASEVALNGASGNTMGIWLGGTSTTAPFRVSKAGAVTASNIAITGGTLSIGSSFNVNNAGILTATGATVNGAITATSLSLNGALTFTAAGSINVNSGVFTVNNLGAVTGSNVTITGGSLSIGSNFTVTNAGNLTSVGGTITGSVFRTSTTTGDGTVNGAGVLINSTGLKAFAASNATAVTSIDSATGLLTSTNANITGAITATSGTFTGTVNANGGVFGGFTLGATTLTATNIIIDSSNGAMTVGSAANVAVQSRTDGFFAGAALVASAPFSVSLAGSLKATLGTVGGFTISNTLLNIGGTSASSISLDTTAGIYVGGTSTGAPFRVNLAGALVATAATISGTINATAGIIGGWDVSNNTISSIAGTAAVNYIALKQGATATDGIWAGGSTLATSMFSVTTAGSVVAKLGTIGGFTMSATDGFYSGAGATRVQLQPGVGIWAGADLFASAKFSVTSGGVMKATDGTITGTFNVLSRFIVGSSTGTRIELDGIGKAIKFFSSFSTGAASLESESTGGGSGLSILAYGADPAGIGGLGRFDMTNSQLTIQLGLNGQAGTFFTMNRVNMEILTDLKLRASELKSSGNIFTESGTVSGGKMIVYGGTNANMGWNFAQMEIQNVAVPRIAFHQPGQVASSFGQVDNAEDFRIYDNAGTGFRGLFLDWVDVRGEMRLTRDGGSYGAGRLTGQRNGWNGLNFDSNMTLMMNYNTQGVHNDAATWVWKFDSNGGEGTLTSGYVPWGRVSEKPDISYNGHGHAYADSSNSSNSSYQALYLASQTQSPAGTFTILEANAGSTQIRRGGVVVLSWASGGKPFVIQHPTKPDNYLQHACIEGPTVDVYYRGEAMLDPSSGMIVVNLPDYFEVLTKKTNRTIQLTPMLSECACIDNTVQALAAGRIYDGKFTVGLAHQGYTHKCGSFYWEVKAERADVVEMEVEPKKSEWTLHGDGPYTYLARP